MLSSIRTSTPLLLSTAFLLMGVGLLHTHIALQGRTLGFSVAMIGVLTSAYYAGFLVGTYTVPRLTHRIGHIRTFAFCTALVTLVVLVQALDPAYGVWLVLRVLQGLLLVGLYAIIESWLNAAAEPAQRSSVFAIYMMVNLGASAVAQQFLRIRGEGFVLFGVVVATIIGVLVERLILRPMVGENPISIIMVTIGLSALLNAVVQAFYGTAPKRQPNILPRGSLDILGASVPINRLVAIVIAGIVLTAFTIFFRKSRHGIAMRAVADDQQAAMTMGISVRRIFALAWALAAVSALIAGILVADISAVDQNIAAFGLLVFPVVILGGLDSVPGCIVGGLVIGLLKQFTAGYLDPGLATVIPYIALVLILLVRPYGIFGETRIERV